MNPAIDARREILLDATLGGEIPLSAMDAYVRRQYPEDSTREIQQRVLKIIRDLAADGLVSLGSMTGPQGQLETWNEPLDSAINRISNAYAEFSYQSGDWWFAVWLSGTPKGKSLAESITENKR